MSGIVQISSDGYLFALFCSSRAILAGNRGRALMAMDKENARFPRNKWNLEGSGRIVLRVKVLKLRGDARLRLSIVVKHVFRRIEVMDRKLRALFRAPGCGEGQGQVGRRRS